MSEKKEPLEIACTSCDGTFRLWIPVSELDQWRSGSSISCIRCGAPHHVKKTLDGFIVESAAPQAPRPVTNGFAVETGSDRRPLVLDDAYDDRDSGAQLAGETPAAPADNASVESTILVVEDDALSRKMVENTLKSDGRRLILVKNGAEALQVLKDERIDLLVVDLYLKNPDDPTSLIDGEEVLREASRMELKVPAIVTTGKELVDDISLDPKWFNYHVKDFIQKGNPFWVDELKDKVLDIIAKR
ncbi:MAG: response regulator [Thermodesulfobacteriota bacterium]